MLKLEAIRAFVVVSQHGNLRDAAAALGRTQSALSMTLSQIEDSLGGQLFETDRKRDLTDLGHFVRDMGAGLVREHDHVMSLIHSYAKGHAGHLRIASVPSVAALILPDILQAFMKTHSGAQIDLMDSDSTTVRTMVATGQADLGIAGPATAGQVLHMEPMFVDQLHVVCRSDSDIAAMKAPLRWQDVAAMPLIANETLSVLTAPDARSVVAQSKLSVRNILSLFAMIESGMGVTVLPGLATRSLGPSLTALPLVGEGSTRSISLLSVEGKAESPLSRAFRQYLEDALPEIKTKFRLNLGAEASAM